MIKLENVVLASPEQMEFIIEGMRNPMNSWEKSDSYENYSVEFDDDLPGVEIHRPYYRVGAGDISLMQRLANAGTDHRKFMRMMPVYVRITAPLYWWKEFDTYKIGSVANSCSTMHKIQEKEFTLEDFSTEHLLPCNTMKGDYCYIKLDDDYFVSPLNFMEKTIEVLNYCRKQYLQSNNKWYWRQMIQLLPSSYNQTRNVMINYEVLANIYKSRKDHKLDEWKVHKTPEKHEFRNKDFASGKWGFCDWIETLPHSELITGKEKK